MLKVILNEGDSSFKLNLIACVPRLKCSASYIPIYYIPETEAGSAPVLCHFTNPAYLPVEWIFDWVRKVSGIAALPASLVVICF